MSKNDTLLELASIVRRSPSAALWVIGFLAVDQELDVLREAVEGAREMLQAEAGRPVSHLQAYRERWGQLPHRD